LPCCAAAPHAPLCLQHRPPLRCGGLLLGLILRSASLRGPGPPCVWRRPPWEGMRASSISKRAGPYPADRPRQAKPPAPANPELPAAINWQPCSLRCSPDRGSARAGARHRPGLPPGIWPGCGKRWPETFFQQDTPGERRLLLAGGCFPDRLLLQLAALALPAGRQTKPLWPTDPACNDGRTGPRQLLAACPSFL